MLTLILACTSALGETSKDRDKICKEKLEKSAAPHFTTAAQVVRHFGIDLLMFEVNPEEYWKILPGRSLRPLSHSPIFLERAAPPHAFGSPIPMLPLGTFQMRRGREHFKTFISRSHRVSGENVVVSDYQWKMMLLFPVSLLDGYAFKMRTMAGVTLAEGKAGYPLSSFVESMERAKADNLLNRLVFYFYEPIPLKHVRAFWIPRPLIGSNTLDATELNEYMLDLFAHEERLSKAVNSFDTWYENFPDFSELAKTRDRRASRP